MLVFIKIKKPKHFVCPVYLDKNNPPQDKHPATFVLLIRLVKARVLLNAMLVLQGEPVKKDRRRAVIVVPELCSMTSPKLAMIVLQESIVVAQTITLVPIVQLDTQTMLPKVDHVCPVYLDKNNPQQD